MAHTQYESCIDACNQCAVACERCAAACLREPDVNMMAKCIALDVDCAQMCRMAVSYMARESEFAVAVCQMCADICDSCAAECASHELAHCQACAAACRSCAQECRHMAGMD